MEHRSPSGDPRIDDALEMALTNVIVNVKQSLDAHMAVYDRVDGKRTTSYDEAVSFTATVRTAYEAAAQALQFVRLARLGQLRMRRKHRLAVQLCEKLIDDVHHNNVIIDHPKCDVTLMGIGLVRFLQALHGTLAEVTADGDRDRHARTFLQYRQWRHEDDEGSVAIVPSVQARGGAFAHRARGMQRVEPIRAIRGGWVPPTRPPVVASGD